MKFRFYKYCFSASSFEQLKITPPISIMQKINLLEEQLVLEYLNKQKNNPGIKSLGNEIRRNKIWMMYLILPLLTIKYSLS